MELQDFARQEKKPRQTVDLFSVSIYENENWIKLPERHHKESLAVQVAVAEAKSRGLPVSILKYPVDPLEPVLLMLTYWPMGVARD